MRALETCFKQAFDQETEDLVIRITEGVIQDPTKYITADFITFLLQRLMSEAGREAIVEKLMLNTRLSI